MREFLKKACFGKEKEYTKTFFLLFLDNWMEKVPLSVGGITFFIFLTKEELSKSLLYSLFGILALQLVTYTLLRGKSYIFMFNTLARSITSFQITLGNKIRRLPMGIFYKKSSAEMLKIIVDDHNTVNSTWLNVIFLSVTIVVNIMLLIVLIPFIHLPMALITLLIIPLSLPFLGISIKRYKKKVKQLKKLQVESGENLIDYVKGISILKLFNMSSGEHKRLQKSLWDLKNTSIEIEKSIFPVGTISNSILNLGIGIIAIVGIYFMKSGSLRAIEYIIFLFIANQIYSPIMTFYLYTIEMINFKYAVDRIYEFRDIEEAKEGMYLVKDENKEIEYCNVDFSYNVEKILKDVNGTIKPNTLNAIVGPSGCGKTTLLKLLLKYFEPTSGEVKLGGKNIAEYKVESLLSQYAMVFQDLFLFNQSVEYNINIGDLKASKDKVIEAAKLANCHDFIMALPQGYSTVVGVNGSKLSAGQRQRISIARAFLKDAPIILMDEPTASLDIENELSIKDALSKLVENKTVVIISHRMAFIKDVDKIFLMNSGQIIAEGTHEELLEKNSLYKKLWNNEQEILNWMI